MSRIAKKKTITGLALATGLGMAALLQPAAVSGASAAPPPSSSSGIKAYVSGDVSKRVVVDTADRYQNPLQWRQLSASGQTTTFEGDRWGSDDIELHYNVQTRSTQYLEVDIDHHFGDPYVSVNGSVRCLDGYNDTESWTHGDVTVKARWTGMDGKQFHVNVWCETKG